MSLLHRCEYEQSRQRHKERERERERDGCIPLGKGPALDVPVVLLLHDAPIRNRLERLVYICSRDRVMDAQCRKVRQYQHGVWLLYSHNDVSLELWPISIHRATATHLLRGRRETGGINGRYRCRAVCCNSDSYRHERLRFRRLRLYCGCSRRRLRLRLRG